MTKFYGLHMLKELDVFLASNSLGNTPMLVSIARKIVELAMQSPQWYYDPVEAVRLVWDGLEDIFIRMGVFNARGGG